MKNVLKNKKGMSRDSFIFLMLFPALFSVLVVTYLPVLKGIIIAFQNYTLFDLQNIHFNGVDNFIAIFQDEDIWKICKNTLLWITVSLFFQFTLGFSLALLLRKKFAGRGVYQGLVFFPWAISGFVIGIMWKWMFNGQMGIINKLLMEYNLIELPLGFLSDPKLAMFSAIISNIWYGIAFFAIMIVAALQGIPEDVYEAADIDGISRFQQFWYITVPFIRPIILLTLLLRVIWIFNFPDLIFSLTGGGPNNYSQIITSYMFNLVYSTQDYGRASALGLLSLLALACYAIIYFKATKFEKAGDF